MKKKFEDDIAFTSLINMVLLAKIAFLVMPVPSCLTKCVITYGGFHIVAYRLRGSLKVAGPNTGIPCSKLVLSNV